MAPHCVGALALITGNKQRLAGNPSLQRPSTYRFYLDPSPLAD
jgi:hypothetical protein